MSAQPHRHSFIGQWKELEIEVFCVLRVMGKIFVSYRRTDPDQQVARQLVDALQAAQHEVFWDNHVKVGQRWAEVIEKNLRESQFLVLLISAESMRSDMVREEVNMARTFASREEKPLVILPIRLAYTAALPYDLAAYLDPIQYTVWQAPDDSARVTHEICAAVASSTPLPNSASTTSANIKGLFAATEKTGAPLPAAELRFETGTVQLNSPFYVARREDSLVLDRARALHGETIIVKGVRQIGKSSLLARAAAAARETGGRILYIDFQIPEARQLKDLDALLGWIAHRMAAEMRPTVKPQDVWDPIDGAKQSLTNYLETAILGPSDKPLALFLDEVDRIFDHTDYCGDFFAMIRAWHNQRATRPDPWERLNLFIAHSTEPSLWIADINQSPFNIGERFQLQDFTSAEVARLNRCYGSPLAESELRQLLALLGGHPYLIRQALYCIACNRSTFAHLCEQAAASDGPFGDHLKRYVHGLSKDKGLKDAFKTILRSGTCGEESHFQRLFATGLITGGDRTKAAPRCQLYADYFPKHL